MVYVTAKTFNLERSNYIGKSFTPIPCDQSTSFDWNPTSKQSEGTMGPVELPSA